MSPNLNPFIKHRIETSDEAMSYIDNLAAFNLLYHFEDPAADCLSGANLTTEQLETIQHNADQIMAVDWTDSAYIGPFDYMISTYKELSQ
ncbi:hypothetical protein [Marinobacter sp. MBR-105]